ncbi:thiopeptide-type bacteriocin biosynthesis protein [Streptomyces sp. NPDC048516]|uniref:thiopeptide-type bacteriocin biosynthesis protein n=1 Tax=Streptomyces sp. NPDC048516 TaxID=3365565 RepID=UPI0037191ADD
MPGRSTVLHARLYAHPQRYAEIIAGHLPGLLSLFENPPRWWFLRHRDTSSPASDQYLMLHLTLATPDDYGPTAALLHDWATALNHQGLAARLELATHLPQAGRYGHGPALDAAYDVFTADSAACTAQLRVTPDGPTSQALTAASMYDLAVQFIGDPRQADTWLTHNLPREHGHLDRDVTRQAIALSASDRTHLLSLPSGRNVADAWQNRSAALRTYRNELASQRNPHTVLRSLLHQHYNRALPIDSDHERSTGRLTRACALRHAKGPQ